MVALIPSPMTAALVRLRHTFKCSRLPTFCRVVVLVTYLPSPPLPPRVPHTNPFQIHRTENVESRPMIPFTYASQNQPEEIYSNNNSILERGLVALALHL